MTVVLLSLVLGWVAAGCGGDAPVDKAEVTLKVRSEGSPERRLLGQIYAQALKIAGYRVKNAPPTFGSTESSDELKTGKLAGYPEYMSTALFYNFGVEIEDIPRQAPAAYKQMRKALEKEGLTAFPPTPYGIENAVGFLSKEAEERGLKTISDLKGKAEEMTVKAPTYCHVSVECIGGIERYYDTAFESVSYERALTPELTWWRTEPEFRYEVLEDNVSDASILYTTDGRLAAEKNRFVVLENDKHIFPASNVVWVTSPETVEEAGPDYEKAIVDAQKGLTLPVMQELNAKLEVKGTQPATVAAEYLESIGYGADSAESDSPTITVGSKITAEEVIIGEIYAQALETAGFDVKREHRLPAGLPPFEQKGLRISGYPEHLNIALKDIVKIKQDVPGDAMKAYKLAKEGLEEKGLTAFPPTSFSRSKGVGMLRKTAEERGLRTLSDLKGQAEEMTIKAGDFCRYFADCLTGIERFYGVSFESFSSIEPTLRYEVLANGEADASMLLSTEGRLAGKKSKFVILEDDKHRLPAGNVFWVTRADLAEEAGPKYEKAIVDAQKGLTLKVMQELDAKVKLEGESPAKVAAEYLKSNE